MIIFAVDERQEVQDIGNGRRLFEEMKKVFAETIRVR
jgi:hypothetical protein